MSVRPAAPGLGDGAELPASGELRLLWSFEPDGVWHDRLYFERHAEHGAAGCPTWKNRIPHG